MNLQGIDLNLLLVFEAIYNDGNLTLAGERLNLSQPAVSNALRRLREKLHDPLFVRTADGMLPTVYTESIINVVTDALSSLRDCFASGPVFEGTSKHNFRLMMGDYNGAIVLPGLMQQIAKTAPNVSIRTLHIDRTSAYEKLRTGRTDLVISTDLSGPGLYQQQLFEDTYVTLVGSENPLVKDQLTLEQFCEIPHVLFSLEGKGSSNVDVALAKRSLKRNLVLRVPHVSVIPQVLEQNHYLATLPARMAIGYLQRYDLKIFQPPVDLAPFTVYQYWHTRQHHDPAVAWLRSQLKEQVFGNSD
ncbi:MAG: LysR family transcriptional regulator [Pseudomonadales bacterium]|nr:LysR family transcriptional regulator [Pseudomonadales bacterium]NRA14587.1 LysR family transcriptional regulator [Oceanospirillaceae bacterium]